MREEVFKVRGVNSPWIKRGSRYYLGFLMDVINDYFKFGAKVYHAEAPFSFLSDLGSMSMESADGKSKILVERVGRTKYVIKGFPEGEDADIFRSNIQDVLDNYLRRIGPDKDEERSKAGSLERRSEELARA